MQYFIAIYFINTEINQDLHIITKYFTFTFNIHFLKLIYISKERRKRLKTQNENQSSQQIQQNIYFKIHKMRCRKKNIFEKTYHDFLKIFYLFLRNDKYALLRLNFYTKESVLFFIALFQRIIYFNNDC